MQGGIVFFFAACYDIIVFYNIIKVIGLKKKNYWNTLAEDVFSKKLLLFFVILITAACFGFTITNYSIGIDDIASDYYLHTNKIGNMIQQGRLLHVVFNLLTNTVDFIPYFNDFVGAVLYALSALLYCGLFQYITGGKFSTAALTAFCGIYISSSVIAEKYIYNLDVVVTILSYCCSAIALMYAYRFVKEKDRTLLLKAIPVLMVAIASYETFLFLYFCGVFAVFLLEIVVNKEDKPFLTILWEGIQYALILGAAIVLYYGLVAVLQLLFPSETVYIRYSVWHTSGLGFFGTFGLLTRDFFQYFVDSFAAGYVPIIVFTIASAIGLVLFGWLSWKRKNVWLLVCYAAMWIGNFIIHYVAGFFTPRAAQTFCFFTAFVLLMLLHIVGVRPLLRNVVIAAIALLVYVQSADMNRWFHNDYVRYQKESFLVDTLATKIASEFDVSKPLIFTNAGIEGYLNTDVYPGGHANGNSMFYWLGYAFGDKTQPFISELFRVHGYDFIVSPTEEQYDAAMLEAEDMPAWPAEGSVQEFDEFIIVNFG